jgi:hypothetical protein
MNERIKLLAIQAGLPLIHDKFMTASQEKFAELIVRECAEVCYDHSSAAGGIDTHFGYGYKDCGDDIKRNFGVEE